MKETVSTITTTFDKQVEEEELVLTFCNWLGRRVSEKEAHYLDMILDNVSDEAVLTIAKQWIKSSNEHKFHYRKA